jgi:hypothetical protein
VERGRESERGEKQKEIKEGEKATFLCQNSLLHNLLILN